MTDSSDPNDDELRDRLADYALRELLGSETPPDLSERILAAAKEQDSDKPQPVERIMNKAKPGIGRWVSLAMMAFVVVGIGMALMLPAVQSSRSAARRMREGQSDQAIADIPPGPHRETLWSMPHNGQGPGQGGDQYDHIDHNSFRMVKDHPISTFSIDVDTASYANVRRFLLRESQLPPPDAVRIEELINYFDYDYSGPVGDVPFAAQIEVAGCPWKAGHRLVRVGLKGKEIQTEQRPPSNLVFLLDVSGSMASPDKLPLLKAGLKLLAEQLGENDRVAIVVYASAEGLVLPSTPGTQANKIISALDRLQAGGSTNGGAGIELAYRLAQENFIEDGVNRVLLCTDGDFNVGTTNTGTLVRMVEEKARSGVFLSVLGFGRGNLNDAMMETVSNKGNGNYAYIDSIAEARKVLVTQAGGTLITIAKDVKIQVEFNPAQVAAYRLIGYENRILAAEDFNDDMKDAGEMGAGQMVTCLYEVVPVGVELDVPTVDALKYQTPAVPGADDASGDELLTLKIRYKEPDGDRSKKLTFPLVDSGQRFGQASADFQYAAAVASFGMLLRNSRHKGTTTYDAVLEIATATLGPDVHGYRREMLEMVRRAKAISER
jgi:Ca-activated chloride channel family protein